MANTLEKIYDTFLNSFEDKPDWIIDFYLKNSLVLNNIKTFDDKDELRTFIEIIGLYIGATYKKDRFNETVDNVNKNLPLIDREISRLDANDLKDEWYNGIIHLKGMASYRLRDYKTSTSVYQYLTNADPQNDSFKNWLNYSLYGQRLWLVNTINILSIMMLGLYLLFKENIPGNSLRLTIVGIGLAGLIANNAYEYYIKRSFRTETKQ